VWLKRFATLCSNMQLKWQADCQISWVTIKEIDTFNVVVKRNINDLAKVHGFMVHVFKFK
jgi:hypothetical protein